MKLHRYLARNLWCSFWHQIPLLLILQSRTTAHLRQDPYLFGAQCHAPPQCNARPRGSVHPTPPLFKSASITGVTHGLAQWWCNFITVEVAKFLMTNSSSVHIPEISFSIIDGCAESFVCCTRNRPQHNLHIGRLLTMLDGIKEHNYR